MTDKHHFNELHQQRVKYDVYTTSIRHFYHLLFLLLISLELFCNAQHDERELA